METYKCYGRYDNRTGRMQNNGYMQNNCKMNNRNYMENRAPEMKKSCCDDPNKHLQHLAVGMGYVPIQEWCELYDQETAICEGTAFPDLNLVFCGVRGKR